MKVITKRVVKYRAHFNEAHAPFCMAKLSAMELARFIALLRNRVFLVRMSPTSCRVLHRHEASRDIFEEHADAIRPGEFQDLMRQRLYLTSGVCRQLLSLLESAIDDDVAERRVPKRHIQVDTGRVLMKFTGVLDYAAGQHKELLLDPSNLNVRSKLRQKGTPTVTRAVI